MFSTRTNKQMYCIGVTQHNIDMRMHGSSVFFSFTHLETFSNGVRSTFMLWQVTPRKKMNSGKGGRCSVYVYVSVHFVY